MYAFRSDHLILVNQLVCSSLGKAISSTFSVPRFCIVVFVGLWPCGHSPIHIGMSIVVLIQDVFT